MRAITSFALANQRIAIVLIALLVVAGIVQFINHPRLEDPAIVIREAIVTAVLPGLEPTKVEDLITRRLEEQIRTIQEVDEIRSDSKTGISLLHVALRDGVATDHFDEIWKDLRAKMNDVRTQLPDGTLGPFVNDEFGETAVATIALWSDGFTLAEMRIVARDMRDRLYALAGVRKVELFGVQDERVFLEFSNAKLAELGISPRVITDALVQQNILLAGGAFDVEGQDVIIEPSGNFESIDDIKALLVRIPDTDQVVNLADLMTVKRGFVDPPDKPAFFDSQPAIVLSVSLLAGFNAVEFGARLTRRVAALEATLPVGYVLDFATYQPALVEKAVNGALLNVYQTLAIVLVVVMLFLGLRTGLIVGAFVPMTMLLGIVVMGRIGVDLERVSIASMIIALGMLVDNGIVVAEDIRTRLEQGTERREACIASGRTLAVPLLTSTLTTVFAFVPMLLVSGSAGEFVRSLGLVIGALLLGSWFLSMYATPVMSFWFMRVKPKPPAAAGTGAAPYGGRFYRSYRSLLVALLRARLPFLALMVVALVGAGLGSRFIVKEFFPPGDRNQFLVYLDLPAGTNARTTTDVVERYTRWLADGTVNPDVTGSVAYVGAGGPRFFLSLAPIDPDPHLAFVVVDTETAAQVPAAVARSRAHLLAAFPELRGRVKPMWLGGTETGLLEVRLVGPDADELFDKAGRLVAALAAIPGTLDIKQDWDNKVLKIRVNIDQARARRAGLTSQEVALSTSSYIDGAQVTDYREGDALIPVIFRAAEAERAALGTIRDLAVYSASRGVNVPLSQIADFEPVWQFSRIKRRDQERAITVSAKHQFLKAGQLFDAVQPAIDNLDLAPGHRWESGGELEASSEAQAKLFAKMPFALVAIVVLLIWQFNSFRRPAIILITVPLSFIGGIIGLLATNAVLSFFAILGFFSLAGIIINNGIVLIDRIDSEIANGKAPYDAVIGAALARLRPIVMTSLTTILGLMPLILSRDPLFFGLASLIAFGLAVGTVLTLGVVPILYTLFFRVAIPSRRAAAVV